MVCIIDIPILHILD